MAHELKTWPKPFQDVWNNEKTFEVRRYDRNFALGDMMLLREWDPDTGNYGRSLKAEITYVMVGGEFGIEAGYVVLGIEVKERFPATAHWSRFGLQKES